MADETPRVNQAGLFSLGQPKSEQSRDRPVEPIRGVTSAARKQLVEKLPGPIEEGAELIRIGHKINNERHRGQHEDRISHGIYPAATC
jgi:hypothetical protein